MTTAYRRPPVFVLLGLGLWVSVIGGLFAVASVPAYRWPWSQTEPLRQASSGLLVSQPITQFTTPYLSFARIRFQAPARISGTLQIRLVSGTEPVGSEPRPDARTILAVNVQAVNDVEYEWKPAEPLQLDPAETFRIAVVVDEGRGNLREQPLPAQADATIGYDGLAPAVTVARYWWPWFLVLVVLGAAALLSPATWPRQRRIVDSVQHLVGAHKALLWLLLMSAALRLMLIAGGGQYFDWDELLYARTTYIFSILSTGNIGAAVDGLLRSPEHPGFTIVGLLPAFFQVVSARSTAHPISDARYPSGEWLAAAVLSLASVCAIGLTYALAHRTGASRKESLLAAFLMASSASMLIYARHFFAYDAAMALLLFALWLGLKPVDHPLRSYTVGLVAGFGFLTYEGYWLMAATVGLVHVLRQPGSIALAAGRGVFFSVGILTMPALLVGAGIAAERPFLEGMIRFSRTVVNGDFSEGWSLPWKYLWNVEHGLLGVYAIGVVLAGILSVRADASRSEKRRSRMWLLTAATIYVALFAGSNVLHRFVVYDRLVRQMLPFICLAAAAGIARLTIERRAGRMGEWLTYVVVTPLFFANALPLMMQRFPREVVHDVMRRYGNENIRLESTVLNSVNVTVRPFLPPEMSRATDDSGRLKRYVLLNTKDIWTVGGPPGWNPPPRGTVLLTTRHPRQLRSLQYHGYRPDQRAFLRSVDFSMQLIDTEALPH